VLEGESVKGGPNMGTTERTKKLMVAVEAAIVAEVAEGALEAQKGGYNPNPFAHSRFVAQRLQGEFPGVTEATVGRIFGLLAAAGIVDPGRRGHRVVRYLTPEVRAERAATRAKYVALRAFVEATLAKFGLPDHCAEGRGVSLSAEQLAKVAGVEFPEELKDKKEEEDA
jgi:hypothetical protein